MRKRRPLTSVSITKSSDQRRLGGWLRSNVSFSQRDYKRANRVASNLTKIRHLFFSIARHSVQCGVKKLVNRGPNCSSIRRIFL